MAEINVLVIGGGFAGMAAAYELCTINEKIAAFKKQFPDKENEIKELDNIRVTVVEKNDSVGGRIYTVPIDKDSGNPIQKGITIEKLKAADQHVEMGGEFIDGNFNNTLYYCGKFGLDVECVEGWSADQYGAIEFSSLYRFPSNSYKTPDTLSVATRALLGAIEKQIEQYAEQFIKKCCRGAYEKKPLLQVTETEEVLLVQKSLTLYEGLAINYSGTGIDIFSDSYFPLRVNAIDTWPEFLIDSGTEWKKISIAKWITDFKADLQKTTNKKLGLREDSSDNNNAYQIAWEIWTNSIGGEYGDPAQVGLAFLIQQAAIYNFHYFAGMDEDEALALRECMRVKQGNQLIAEKMLEELKEPHELISNISVQKITQNGEHFSVSVEVQAGGNAGDKAKLEGIFFNKVILATPQFAYQEISYQDEIDTKKLSSNPGQSTDKLPSINIGRHGKVAIRKNSEDKKLVNPQLKNSASVWCAPQSDIAGKNNVASQVWGEVPFQGEFGKMEKGSWATFYLTYRSLAKAPKDLPTDCKNWTKANLFVPGTTGNDCLLAGEKADPAVESTRYDLGYAAYGPGPITNEGSGQKPTYENYLKDWQFYINANKNGLPDIPNLILAGEHCDDKYVGYMEGALRTGRKAAKAVINQILKGDGADNPKVKLGHTK